MTYSFVSAVNDHAVLDSCLLRSPDVAAGGEIFLQEGYPSAAAAYNRALEKATADIVIFIHQDVYLPPDWLSQLESTIHRLAASDPNWGVLGVCGLTAEGVLRSWVYSAGLDRILGAPFETPQQVRTLDEVLLIVRRASALRFDEQLAGFHMYGTDLCLEAEKRGMKNYAIPCFVYHNSNGIKNLPWVFWRACLYVRSKWLQRLPIYSPCTTVSRIPLRLVRQVIERYILFNIRKRRVGRRKTNPATHCAELLRRGCMPH